ncbi:dispanin subfamily A member 2b [Lates calcarifer]|uniref:Dispanin subfamily A member 2b n=1 Tax=Lates calcarifer TaxID=8187 RepID=A0A4W6CFJ5_LATCA|nr:dispanin subfamily A member 2b [Lates calcarifer]
MGPEGRPAEVLLLQGKFDGYPGGPGGPAVVQCTTVDMPPEPPRDYIIWSLISFFYSNPCCLGLVAIIYSIKARDRKVVGDMEGARRHANTARGLNIAATVLFCVLVIITIVFYIICRQRRGYFLYKL